MALILSTLHLIMNLLWWVNCSKGLSSCSLLALWSRYKMHSCHDESITTSLARSWLYTVFIQAAGWKIVVSQSSAGCTWMIIGGFSLYMVLVSYSSAFKRILRLMKGREEGGHGRAVSHWWIFFSVSTLHSNKCKQVLYEITNSCSP